MRKADLAGEDDMSVRKRFRELLASPGLTLMPGAYDALSARIIEQQGFEAVVAGGYAAVSGDRNPIHLHGLAARLFGNVSNADASYLPVAVPLCLAAATLLVLSSRRLNIVALGRDASIGLGLNHRRETMRVLFLVSVLMAVSTALVGPMTFLGFLVATLAYQFADTYDHRYVFPVAALTCFVVLSGAYFVMRNIFYANGVVSIIIELVGGLVFLFVILRKGRL
jgi:iron complex transport system permease protein